jgi:hypothetical protein
MQFHLSEAQSEIEKVIGFPLSPKWFADEVHPFRSKILTKMTNVLELGIEAITNISLNATVTLTSDPATVTIATALTSVEGIKIYYPGTDEEIYPSNMVITGGNLVISVPKCRIVKYTLLDNPSNGLLYTDSIYQDKVDVKRRYTDPSDQITVVWPHQCNPTCSSTGCVRYIEPACGIILDPEIGEITYEFATYSSESWVRTHRICCKGEPQKIEINYKAGMQVLDPIAETAIIRLAHSKMPYQPCGCDAIINMWRRDATIPQILSVERLECPFGLSNGAWMAWKFAGQLAIERMSVFG